MSGGRRALLLDYGGVLTIDLATVFARADDDAGLPRGTIGRVIVGAYRDPEGDGFVHRLERGEIDRDGFGVAIQQELMANGFALHDPTVLDRVFADLRPDHESGLWAVVRSARRQGIATGLLSNSWGTDGYPLDLLRECFEDLVLSGEVGLRKPDPAIFELACERLSVAPADAVFVDDFEVNVEAARTVGLRAVHHRGDVDATTAQLEELLGVTLR